MQLAAVASGSFWSGAVIMGAFAIGTLPVLFSVGIGSTYARKESLGFAYKLIGVVIIFFGVYSLNSGLVLTGSPVTIDFWNRGGVSTLTVIEDNIQVVKMNVDWGFDPTEFVIKKDVPVRWEINGINISGCSSEIVIPSLNIRNKIEKGLNVVEFIPEDEGVIHFSCGMGMISGKFVVIE